MGQINNQAHAEKQAIEADKTLVPILESLMTFVDNPGKATMGLRGGLYRNIETNGKINSVHYNGCEIGYRLTTGDPVFTLDRLVGVGVGADHHRGGFVVGLAQLRLQRGGEARLGE